MNLGKCCVTGFVFVSLIAGFADPGAIQECEDRKADPASEALCSAPDSLGNCTEILAPSNCNGQRYHRYPILTSCMTHTGRKCLPELVLCWRRYNCKWVVSPGQPGGACIEDGDPTETHEDYSKTTAECPPA